MDSAPRLTAAHCTARARPTARAWFLAILTALPLLTFGSASASNRRSEVGLESSELHVERLPSGVVIALSRDDSLPVAATVFAIERGTRNDPAGLPGLIHALAHQLQMGNRELAPGTALADTLDRGGLARMAVGPGQIRYANLFPVAVLPRAIEVEARRLRVPTVNTNLWLRSLAHARENDGAGRRQPLAAIAGAWRDSAIRPTGHQVNEALAALPEGVVAQHLARSFSYSDTTLVIVAPGDGLGVLAQARESFAGLPSASPSPPPPSLDELWPKRADATPLSSATLPVNAIPPAIEHPGVPTQLLAWPIAADAETRLFAQVICELLNRKPRGRSSVPVRARCQFHDDPYRPTLLIHVREQAKKLEAKLHKRGLLNAEDDHNAMAWRGIRARLDAILNRGAESANVKQSLTTVRRRTVHTMARPLELAVVLAQHPRELRRLSQTGVKANPERVDRRELLALSALDDGLKRLQQVVQAGLSPERLLVIDPPGRNRIADKVRPVQAEHAQTNSTKPADLAAPEGTASSSPVPSGTSDTDKATEKPPR